MDDNFTGRHFSVGLALVVFVELLAFGIVPGWVFWVLAGGAALSFPHWSSRAFPPRPFVAMLSHGDPSDVAMARINEALKCYRCGDLETAVAILESMDEGQPLGGEALTQRAYLRAEIEALRGDLASAQPWLDVGRRADAGAINPDAWMAEALLCAAREDRAAFLEVFAKIDASEVGYHPYRVLEYLAEHLARHGNREATWQLAPIPVDATNPLLAIAVSRWPTLEERNDSRL